MLLVYWLGNLGKKALTNIAISLATDNSPGLVSNLISNATIKFERKISGKGAVRAGKGFTLFILNRDMNDIRTQISWSFVSNFGRVFSAANNSGKGVRRAGR